MVIPVLAAKRARTVLRSHRFMHVATRDSGGETSHVTYDRELAQWVVVRIIWERFATQALQLSARERHIGLLGLALSRLSEAIENALDGRRRGVTVALLGPDGSGKSTIAAQIAGSFALPVRRLYMGLWQRAERPGRSAWLPGWSLLKRLLVVWSAYLQGRYYQERGCLVIFDRYSYDALVPAVGRRTARARLYAWILGHGCPAPDLTVLLDAPGELMHQRKRESNPVDLEIQRQGFLSLRKRLPLLRVLDATREEEALRAELIDLIWRRYFGGS